MYDQTLALSGYRDARKAIRSMCEIDQYRNLDSRQKLKTQHLDNGHE